MRAEYYYIISSLPELQNVEQVKKHPFPQFDDFCQEQLKEEDYQEMKQCFLFNDVRNIGSLLKENTLSAQRQKKKSFPQSKNPEADFFDQETEFFHQPSYYSEENLVESLADPAILKSSVAEFLFDYQNERLPTDARNLETSLLQYLFDDSKQGERGGREKSLIPQEGFVRDYLFFELDLRNLNAALSRRSLQQSYEDQILVADYFSQRIATNTAVDFGLAGDLGFYASLIELDSEATVLEKEKTINAVRWAWLDEKIETCVFSREAVFAYAIKIADTERWLKMDHKAGARKMDRLMHRMTDEIAQKKRKEE